MKRLVSIILVLTFAVMLSLTAFAATFTDVGSENWAYSYIERAAADGIVGGIGDGSYAPDAAVSYVQFIAMMTRAFYADDLALVNDEGEWYEKNLTVARMHGLLDGTDTEGVIAASSSAEITRFDMAYMIYNIITDKNFPVDESGLAETLASIPDVSLFPEDEYCRKALGTVYGLGIITGIDEKGTFAGEATMTRAQAATVYCRIADAVNVTYSENALIVGGKTYTLGMTEAELIAAAGEPEETQPSVSGYTWYIYGIETYENFFMAGVADGKVSALCSAGKGFNYMGATAGSAGNIKNSYGGTLIDTNDSDIVHAVYISDGTETSILNDSTLMGEAKVNFHLTNAFRAYHGKTALKWSSIATTAALRHAQDMAENNYFSHTSRDGTTFSQRLTNVGINWSSASENICYGYRTGVTSYNAWVNSAGHRENMLRDRTYIGIAYAYNSTIYGVQDYYS